MGELSEQTMRIADLEGALRAVSLFLLVVDSKRRDHFVNWTPDTTKTLDALRAIVRAALGENDG